MLLTFKDRDTPFSTTFSQLLIREQFQCCKLNMLICITNVSVVFPSSPGSISVVFPMCLRSLPLFVYSLKSVIQVHYVPSTCKSDMNVKNEKLGYVLFVEY